MNAEPSAGPHRVAVPAPVVSATATATPAAIGTGLENRRLDFLDATRAFALVLGVVFHSCLSFAPIFMGWAVQDVSTSPLVSTFMTIAHSFRMELFFLLAGFFSHRTFHRGTPREFVRSRMVRIAVPLVVGWFVLRPLLVSGWIMGSASLRGSVDIPAAILAGFRSLGTLPAGIFAGSHLWFLYYLLLITALTLAARQSLARTGSWGTVLVGRADRMFGWLAESPASWVVLAIPTAGVLGFMRSWGMDTPDRSLVPHMPALAIYGGFFVLGWLLDRRRDGLSGFARLSWHRWGLAVLGVAGILLLGDIERDPAHRYFDAAHIAFAFCYALTMWSLVFLTISVFQQICRRPNPVIRYVADSSYWMYLIHLPVVVWLQVAVAEVPLPWWLKLTFVATATIAFSLATYALLIRKTFIGRVLNGRR